MLKNTKVIVHILVCVFAIASWADLNGMWAELPLLTQGALPEAWTLPSYIIIISQVANVGPLIFVLVSYLAPWTKPKLEKVTSFIVIIISMASSFLMAFLWKKTTYFGDTEHSTALLCLNFFLAVGDCTSSVSFYAFMSHLKPEYMASLFIGEGLSGFLPAIIALGQGAGDVKCNGTQQLNSEPRFSVEIYFIILSVVIALSAVSFLLLNFWGYCKSEMVDRKPTELEKIIDVSKENGSTYGTLGCQDSVNGDEPNISSKCENAFDGPYSEVAKNIEEVSNGTRTTFPSVFENENPAEVVHTNESFESPSLTARSWIQIRDIPMWKFFLLMAVLVMINMTLTTFLSSIQIYSVLPYGLQYYLLTSTLPQIANTLASTVALFYMAERLLVILSALILGQVCVAYLIYVAAMSPDPPLHGETSGGVIAVLLWVIVTLFLVYAKVCVAGVMRKEGRNALIWAGVATQAGSLIGAIVGFVLVNQYNVFKSASFC